MVTDSTFFVCVKDVVDEYSVRSLVACNGTETKSARTELSCRHKNVIRDQIVSHKNHC